MTKINGRIIGALFLILSLLAACGGTTLDTVQDTAVVNTPASEAPTTVVVTSTEVAPTESADSAEEPAAVEEKAAEVTETVTHDTEATTALEPTDTAVATPEVAAAEPVKVEFFTPAQQEGPYYPVEKPADRDNDLVSFEGASAPPVGEILEFGGTVYGADGYAIEGAVIEIWQTDASGVYQHPNDPGTANRDRNFQFYGEAQTDAQGRYHFRTIMPGLYEPRPRHIHVRVLVDGREVLTTQFYFAGELALQGADALMLIDAQPGEDEMGNPVLSGTRDIFLNSAATGG